MSGSKNSNGVIKYFFLPPLPFAPRSPFLWLATSSVGLMCAVKLENAIWTGRTRMSLPDTFSRSLNCFSLIWLKYCANPWTKHCWKEQVMTWLARSRSPPNLDPHPNQWGRSGKGSPGRSQGAFIRRRETDAEWVKYVLYGLIPQALISPGFRVSTKPSW